MNIKNLLFHLPVPLQRLLFYDKNSPKAVRKFVKRSSVDIKRSICDIEFLALDFETTGLDPTKDRIVSIGFVPVRKNRIVMKESGHYLIAQTTEVSEESILIHKITNEAIANQHIQLSDALLILLKALRGKVVIAHNASIEKNFLAEAMRRCFDAVVPIYFVDTMQIEMKKSVYKYSEKSPTKLRLYQLREQYNLPQYHAHHALEDAIATAELFLLQMNNMANNLQTITVKEII